MYMSLETGTADPVDVSANVPCTGAIGDGADVNTGRLLAVRIGVINKILPNRTLQVGIGNNGRPHSPEKFPVSSRKNSRSSRFYHELLPIFFSTRKLSKEIYYPVFMYNI
jgi:hypothetical protein